MIKTSPDITRAAEKYIEQYGDPLVMNTYLKITILVLAAVCLSLAALVFRSQRALADLHPLIVRINEVGRAEAIDYRNFQYRPQEAENKYYLTRWAELYFSRNRFTIERDQTNSLYFLNGDVQRAVIDQERIPIVGQNQVNALSPKHSPSQMPPSHMSSPLWLTLKVSRHQNGMNLVPLLVPLCTVILCFSVRQGAMWITGPSISF
ncbi:VirB8/TrbF family protein [Edaphobacter aggregans]|uniref:VirB8/TrbF family protein n=1 Tax=Edaphobacter aggregans TaxID=570835 RepID=UPI000557A515|nr:VirB8/TrbF family protein [Edaphobacter aggregans]